MNQNKLTYIAANLFFAAVSLPGFAQQTEEPDSLGLSYDLQELVVEGRTQKLTKDGVEYMPGKKVKEHSYDVASLLQNMMIPQVRVVDGSISTLAGSAYSIYIDYVPATENDMKALRPQDVLRVDVLKSPQDPRFSGNMDVINIILRKYEWGGYTKLMAYGRVINGEELSGGIYQKFRLKDWTIDAAGNVEWYGREDVEKTLSENFRGITLNGKRYTDLQRDTKEKLIKNSNNSQDATIRGSYNRDMTYVAHSFSFKRQGMPKDVRDNSYTYSDGLPDAKSWNNTDSQSITYDVSGRYQFGFGKENFLMVNWEFSNSHNRNNSFIRYSDNSDIFNASQETTYNPQGSLEYSKGLGHDNTLTAAAESNWNIYNTDYSGSYTGRQKLLTNENIFFINYSHTLGFGLKFWANLGLNYSMVKLNGEKMSSNVNPRIYAGGNYRINENNELILYAGYHTTQPDANTTNNALIQKDELIWLKGNPHIGDSKYLHLELTYNFIPTNWLQVPVSAQYTRERYYMFKYDLQEGLDGVVRTFTDDSHQQSFYIVTAPTFRLFNNSLMITAMGSLKKEMRTGYAPMSFIHAQGGIQLAYYYRNLSASLFYLSPQKYLVEIFGSDTNGILTKHPSYVDLSLTYSLRNFVASLSFRNWIGQREQQQIIATPVYNATSRYTSLGLSMGLNLNLTYTIPYGKKVSNDDEVINNARKHSSVLQ